MKQRRKNWKFMYYDPRHRLVNIAPPLVFPSCCLSVFVEEYIGAEVGERIVLIRLGHAVRLHIFHRHLDCISRKTRREKCVYSNCTVHHQFDYKQLKISSGYVLVTVHYRYIGKTTSYCFCSGARTKYRCVPPHVMVIIHWMYVYCGHNLTTE